MYGTSPPLSGLAAPLAELDMATSSHRQAVLHTWDGMRAREAGLVACPAVPGQWMECAVCWALQVKVRRLLRALHATSQQDAVADRCETKNKHYHSTFSSPWGLALAVTPCCARAQGPGTTSCGFWGQAHPAQRSPLAAWRQLPGQGQIRWCMQMRGTAVRLHEARCRRLLPRRTVEATLAGPRSASKCHKTAASTWPC